MKSTPPPRMQTTPVRGTCRYSSEFFFLSSVRAARFPAGNFVLTVMRREPLCRGMRQTALFFIMDTEYTIMSYNNSTAKAMAAHKHHRRGFVNCRCLSLRARPRSTLTGRCIHRGEKRMVYWGGGEQGEERGVKSILSANMHDRRWAQITSRDDPKIMMVDGHK